MGHHGFTSHTLVLIKDNSYFAFSAETIKGIHTDIDKTKSDSLELEQLTKVKNKAIDSTQIKFDYLNLRDDTSITNPSNKEASNSGYSDEEKRVLAVTSIINGREYVPFMSVDLKERFAFPVPFTGVIQNTQFTRNVRIYPC